MLLIPEKTTISKLSDLALERDDGNAGGVEQNTVATEAQESAFDFEDDRAVDVSDVEITVRHGHHLLDDGEIHGIRGAELLPHDGDWVW